MYAIVEIKGQQFKAEEGKFLYVHHLGDVKQGDAVSFEKVLLLDADGNVTVGAPAVEGAKIECEVLELSLRATKCSCSRRSAARAIVVSTDTASSSPK